MKKRMCVYLLVGIVAVVGVILVCLFATSNDVYAKYCSPDFQYSVTARQYIFSMFVPMLPGQGGDVSGKIYLYDEKEKKQIASASISMLSRVSDLQWSGHTAYFTGEHYPTILDPWVLPRELQSDAADQTSRLCHGQ